MKGLRILGALLAAASFGAPAFAQSGSGYNLQQRGMNETFRLDVGGFFQKFDTTVRLDASSGIPGTDINLESMLGQPDSKTSLRADGYLRLGPHASLQFGYRGVNRESSTALSRDVQWGDQTYHVGARVDSQMRVDVGELYYAYSIVNSGDSEFALMLGVSGYFTKVALSSTGTVTGGGGSTTASVQAEDRSIVAPIPSVGALFRYALFPRVFVWGKVKGLTATISGYHGSMFDWSAGTDVFITSNFGVGGGYEYAKIDFDHRESRTYSISYTVSGPIAYLSIAF